MTNNSHSDQPRDSAETTADIIKFVVTGFAFTMFIVFIAVMWLIT
jgi:hypothetical protein